jgi:uncharacterized membrane protein YqhA
MRSVFSLSRSLVYIAVFGLLLATLAVFVFGGIMTVTTIASIFQHGDFNAEGARVVSVEFIELMDLFLLGTVLLITAIGLYELFLDPGVREIISEWLSVTNLEQLKFNLLAVVVVMLGILFLGAVAGGQPEGMGILESGVAISAILAALALVVYVFDRTTHQMEQARRLAAESVHAEAAHGVHTEAHDA